MAAPQSFASPEPQSHLPMQTKSWVWECRILSLRRVGTESISYRGGRMTKMNMVFNGRVNRKSTSYLASRLMKGPRFLRLLDHAVHLGRTATPLRRDAPGRTKTNSDSRARVGGISSAQETGVSVIRMREGSMDFISITSHQKFQILTRNTLSPTWLLQLFPNHVLCGPLTPVLRSLPNVDLRVLGRVSRI